MEPIYLDYNATTPVDPAVAAEMQPYIDRWFGNPSSSHAFAAEPRAAILKARSRVASLIGANGDEILFTSGGSESNNLALKGAAFAGRQRGNHIITSSVEHPAVTEVCRYLERMGFRVTWLPVDGCGRMDPLEVERAILPETILVSVMLANNETGTLQPVREISSIARSRGILVHTDAAQAAGKIPVNVDELGVDLLTLAGHKFYAPKGVGALYIRRGTRLEKLIHGADHESDRRAGTENVIQVAGLGMAAQIAMEFLAGGGNEEIRRLRDRFTGRILAEVPQARLNGHPSLRLPNTASIGFPGVEADRMLLAMKGVAASAGAACHADRTEISAVLTAMKVPREYAIGTIRFSFGKYSTEEEADRAADIVISAFRELSGGSKEMQHRTSAGSLAPEIIPAESAGWSEWNWQADRETSSAAAEGSAILPGLLQPVKMTEYTHALGCACKIRPVLLERILKDFPAVDDPAVLVGFDTSDDAAVYRIGEDRAIVQTVDFIPPVVDDPYEYGAIAAANSISDIYAMGGEPLFALSIVGFPDRKLDPGVLQQILKGANDKVAEAGIRIIGGHTIEDSEPKFGLCVTGMIHPDRVLRNSGAKPGDALILTKPVGTGIITTALKQGLAGEAAARSAVAVMAQLNRAAASVMSRFPVNACTDVTGFGLLGHLKEMVCGAGIRALLDPNRVPVLAASWDYTAAGAIPGGTRANLEYAAPWVEWQEGISEIAKLLLADAQTSGGLLIAVPAAHATEMVAELKAAGCPEAGVIGSFIAGNPGITVGAVS